MNDELAARLVKAIEEINHTLVHEIHTEKFAIFLGEILESINDNLERIAAALDAKED